MSNEIKKNIVDFLRNTNLKDLTAVTVVCDLLCRFNNLNLETVRNLVSDSIKAVNLLIDDAPRKLKLLEINLKVNFIYLNLNLNLY